MRCPNCGVHFGSRREITRCPYGEVPAFAASETSRAGMSSQYPRRTELFSDTCPNCNHLVVALRLVEADVDQAGDEWTCILHEHVIYPPPSPFPAPVEVPDRLRRDFHEAAAVIGLSPKASAALGRRILQEVLRDACGCTQHNLSKQVEDFVGRPDTPSSLREQLHALREVGNFAAHTQKDTDTGLVLDVEPGEAEWLLETLLELFDHVYVKPAKRRFRLNALNEKLVGAGRTPLSLDRP